MKRVKTFLFLVFILLLQNCSFDNKSNIWKNKNTIEEKDKDLFENFESLQSINKSYNEIKKLENNIILKYNYLERKTLEICKGLNSHWSIRMDSLLSRIYRVIEKGYSKLESDEYVETIQRVFVFIGDYPQNDELNEIVFDGLDVDNTEIVYIPEFIHSDDSV